jgi:hypothetical protein
MVVPPRKPMAGVIVKLRLVPLPPKMMFPFGTREVSEDVALNTRSPAAVSTSPIVKKVALLTVLSTVERSGMLEIVGAV